MGKLKEKLMMRQRSVEEHRCYENDLSLKDNDPVKFEVLYTKTVQLVLASREVAKLISASPMVRESGEVVFAVFTPEGDAICLSLGLMVHVHTMSRMIKWMIMNDYEEKVGIREGDYFLNNDPYIGGVHTPDQNVVTPIFHEGEIVGWAGGISHVPETGAIEPGGLAPSASTRFEEGLFLPCLKIAENDEMKRDVEILIDRSVRSSIWWLLDNKAKLAGCRMIREGINKLIDEYGIEYYKKAAAEYIEDTMRATAKKIKMVLSPGRFRSAAFYDIESPKGKFLIHSPIEMTVTKEGNIILDFNGLSSAGPHAYNATPSGTEGVLFCTMIQYLFYDSRYNEGTFLAVNLNIPKGSIFNPPNIFYAASFPIPAISASLAWHDCLSRAYYAKGYREEIMAPLSLTDGMFCGGIDQYGRMFGNFVAENAGSGTGAFGLMDGLNTACASWNPEGDTGDAEIWEQMIPIIWLGRYIHMDGGGFGKYRGGHALKSIYFIQNTETLQMGSWLAGHRVFCSPGLMGGYPAGCNYRNVARNTNLEELIQNKNKLPHREGDDPSDPELFRLLKADKELGVSSIYISKPIGKYDIWEQINGSGGGYGDPIERDPMLVAKDLENGLTSIRTADKVYCVAINPSNLEIDLKKTEELRTVRREERKTRGIPAKDYKNQGREKILKGEIPDISKKMFNDILVKNEKFHKEYKEFWKLPDDFEKLPEAEMGGK